MNVIFFSKREGRARQLNLAHPLALGIAAVLGLSLLGTAFGIGMHLGQTTSASRARGDTAHWAEVLTDQKRQIADLKQQLQERVDAMAMRLGEVNAHVIRLNALGKRLTEMADIDNREFDFDSDPPTGGPESDGEGVSAQIPDLTQMIGQLEARVQLPLVRVPALTEYLRGIGGRLIARLDSERFPYRLRSKLIMPTSNRLNRRRYSCSSSSRVRFRKGVTNSMTSSARSFLRSPYPRPA